MLKVNEIQEQITQKGFNLESMTELALELEKVFITLKESKIENMFRYTAIENVLNRHLLKHYLERTGKNVYVIYDPSFTDNEHEIFISKNEPLTSGRVIECNINDLNIQLMALSGFLYSNKGNLMAHGSISFDKLNKEEMEFVWKILNNCGHSTRCTEINLYYFFN